jgi:hypothetical protein
MSLPGSWGSSLPILVQIGLAVYECIANSVFYVYRYMIVYDVIWPQRSNLRSSGHPFWGVLYNFYFIQLFDWRPGWARNGSLTFLFDLFWPLRLTFPKKCIAYNLTRVLRVLHAKFQAPRSNRLDFYKEHTHTHSEFYIYVYIYRLKIMRGKFGWNTTYYFKQNLPI